MINKKGIAVLHAFEGCILKAYPDPATNGEPYTIGYGATFYQNGTKVRLGDKLSQTQADELLVYHVTLFEKGLKELVKVQLTNNQWSALLVLTYNIGIGNLRKSTLLKKLNINPNDNTLKLNWLSWCRANGKVMKGLIRRRMAEWELYITKDEPK